MRNTYSITPTSKPRQTQRDKWAKRPSVMRYRAFADSCREEGVVIPKSGCHVTFYMPMPASWSQKKRANHFRRPHQQRPDIDNLLKSLLDAVHKDDSGVWDIRATKVWNDRGQIVIETGE